MPVPTGPFTFHFVPEVHWDREWMTSSEESRVLLAEFMQDLLALLASDPSFTSFILDGHTALVRDHLEVHPDDEERIAQFVREGRLCIGPWYILADEFLPSGEAHVRNLALGIGLAGPLGGAMPVGYLPDQFGHIAQMPQILAGFGIGTAVIYRGFGGEPGQESSEYAWRAPDGTEVLMLHLHRDGYSFGYFMGDDEEGMRARFQRLAAGTTARAQTPHVLVLNGGDRHWPDETLPAAVELLQNDGIDARISTISKYISLVRACAPAAGFPVWEGESRLGLAHAFAIVGGTASARMPVKQANAACQVLLERIAEPLNAVAVMGGARDRAALIARAWMLLIENQDHDVLCGTCVDPTYTDAAARFKHVRELGAKVAELCLEELLPVDPDAHGDDRVLHFFNPLPAPRTEVVACTIDFHIRDVMIGINPDFTPAPDTPPVRGFEIRSAAGARVPFQVTGREEAYGITYTRHGYPHQTRTDRFHVLVRVTLPPCGSTHLDVLRTDAFPVFTPEVTVDGNALENGRIRAEAAADGRLAVRDLRTGIGFSDLHILEDGGDCGDTYSWCPPAADLVRRSTDAPCTVRVAEEGPLRAALEITTVMDVPARSGREARDAACTPMPVTVRVALTADAPQADITVTVDNRAEDHRLRAVFDTALPVRTSHAGAQFAIITREHAPRDAARYTIEKPVNLEVLQRHVTVQHAGRALTLFTRGLHEYELATDASGRLALTLLRCVGELSKDGLATRPGGDAGWKNATPAAQCAGVHVFEYALMPHAPDPAFAAVTRAAECWHTPVVVAARKTEADDDADWSLLRVDSHHSVWSALRASDDDEQAFVLRLYNPVGARDTAVITTDFTVADVQLVNLAGDPESTGTPPRIKARGITVELAPFRIVTLKIVAA